jgi:hypothetical protein
MGYLTTDALYSGLGLLNINLFSQDEVVSPMLNPQPGGRGFDVGVCFPWEVGILLRNTPFPLVEGHSLPIQLG